MEESKNGGVGKQTLTSKMTQQGAQRYRRARRKNIASFAWPQWDTRGTILTAESCVTEGVTGATSDSFSGC